MKNLKKITTIVSLVLLGVGMSNSIVIINANTQGYDGVIAVVFSTGGLGDQSFNDMANTGLLAARVAYNLSVSTVEPIDVPGINAAINSFAQDSENDIIIAVGFSGADGIQTAASAYPNRNFTIIDSVVNLANVASITFKEQEGSFLAGALAALTTSTNKLGFFGGLDIPLIHRFGSGFEQGARWINPAITVTWAYSPDPANPWGDLAGGKIVAQSMIDTGVDIIFAAAGGTGIGVMDAVQQAVDGGNQVYAIGVDSNQDHLYPGIILTSMMKRVDVAVKTQIDSVVDGTWDQGTHNLGLAEGGVGITPMEFTQAEASSKCGSSTRLSFVNSLTGSIINGGIIVEEGIQTPDNYNTITHDCSGIGEGSITITKTETIVSTSTITISPVEATTTKTVKVTETFSETKSEVGISAPTIGGIVFLLVTTFVVRRRK